MALTSYRVCSQRIEQTFKLLVGILIGAAFASPLFSASCPISGTTTVNFDLISGVPAGVFSDATAFLASYGITLSGVTAGAQVGVTTTNATNPPFRVVFNEFNSIQPATMTLNFCAPLTSFTFNRQGIGSNNTSPAWSAQALDASGTQVASVGEGIVLGAATQAFTLSSSTGITAVRINSMYTGRCCTFSGPPLSDFRLVPSQDLSAPTNLHALQIGFTGDRVQLSWDYNGDPVEGFRVESQLPLSTTWDHVMDLADPDARLYDPPHVPSFGTISYRVSAYQGGRTSDPSNVATAFQIQLNTANCIRDLETGRITSCMTPTLWPVGLGFNNAIFAYFTPDSTHSVTSIAQNFHYNHFNWISVISSEGLTTRRLLDYQQKIVGPAPPPYIDPPRGGYDYERELPGSTCPTGPTDDFLPYYYAEELVCNLPSRLVYNHIRGETLDFFDSPNDPDIVPPDSTQFVTALVGVPEDNSTSTLLGVFAWGSNNHINAPAVHGDNSIDQTIFGSAVIPSSSDTGAVFNLRFVDPTSLPLSTRNLLIASGVKGIDALSHPDRSAPLTSSVLSGQQIAEGLYMGNVQVSLLATDLEGPENIQSTTYSLDSGDTFLYTLPFVVSGSGTHTIQFGSTDRAGNVETPRQTRTFRIGLLGDINGDGLVNCADIVLIKAAFGKRSDQIGFNVEADANLDGVVDIRDLALVSQHLSAGTVCTAQP